MHAAGHEPELCHGLEPETENLYKLMDFSLLQEGIIMPIFPSKKPEALKLRVSEAPRDQAVGGR